MMHQTKGEPKIHQLTVDLRYPGDPYPRVRLRFYGVDREECEEQLLEHAERDRALRELVIEGRDESREGLILEQGYKLVHPEKVRRGAYA